MRNNKAFTLIEILVIVCILGLLAAISIPNFQRENQVIQTNAVITTELAVH